MRGSRRLLRFAIILACFCASMVAQPLTTPVNVTPDCLVFFDLTAVGNSAQFDNRFIGCDSWTVSYTNTGFATLSLIFQSSPDNGGVPGGFVNFAGGIVAGVNPNVNAAQESTLFKGFYPWLRVRLDATTGGPGRVRGTYFGYRSPSTAYTILSGLSTVTANQGTPAVQANRWPVFLSDGANPIGTAANPLLTNLSTPCTLSAPIELAPAGIGDQQLIALTAGKAIRVCSISLSASGAADLKFIQGTGANCVTGPANVTGTYRNVLSAVLGWQSNPLTLASAQALCVNSSAAVNIGGLILYDKF
jgi:hypothetical protein